MLDLAGAHLCHGIHHGALLSQQPLPVQVSLHLPEGGAEPLQLQGVVIGWNKGGRLQMCISTSLCGWTSLGIIDTKIWWH